MSKILEKSFNYLNAIEKKRLFEAIDKEKNLVLKEKT